MSQKKPLTLSTAKRKSRISAKLAKKSEIAAKKLDKDVAKLKVKEFRESEVQSTASPDIVASKSWRLPSHAATQLVNTEESTEQKPDSQSATVDIDNRHVTAQSASSSTDSEKTLSELPHETQNPNAPKFQDYGSSESTHLGQGPHFDDTQLPLVTLSQLPEIGHVKQQIEPAALTVSMARTTLTQIVRPPIISTEQHTPLTIDEQAGHQSVKEDAPVASASGKLHAHGGTVTPLQWTVAEHQGQFGRLDIDPITGEWHYQLDNNALNTDALAEGEHQTEQFTVTVSGPNGEQVSTVIIIDVEGSNDLPQILGSHLASINAADSLPAVTGQLHSIDPDHNDVITWAVLDGQGQYGQLSINPLTGQWQYQLNNHANATLALVSGQQVTETFTVTATDQSGHPVSQQVSIQVNGADNTAIIQGDMTGLVAEDTQALNGQLTVSGQLSIQDPDKDQAHFSAGSLQGQFGYLTIDVNGHWIYSADNSLATVQSLKSGEHLTDTFTIHSADGTAQNITVTINGTDDKAEISGTTSASLTEDSDTYQGMLRADGNITITDNDHGPHLFTATEQYGQFGTLIIDEFGHWTYTADNSQTAIQALKTGESITDTLVVQTQDGTQQTISITIHGTDDHSVIMGTSVMRVFEDKRLSQGQLHTDGQLWVSNPDTGRAGFAAEQLQGKFGILSINTHGHWTYTADNNPSIQALKHGESLTETLFLQAFDGTSQKITILIKGADDKAIIGGTDTATLVEDQSPQPGQLQAHGTLTITDPDADQAQFTALTDVAGSNGYGHFSLNSSGVWTYNADNTQTAVQQLKTGESLTDTFTVSSVDGTSHTVTVTIQGNNDAPVLVGQTQSVTEDGTQLSGKMLATDVDAGDTQTFSLVNAIDGFTLNADGSYSFDPSHASYQHLTAGQTQDVVIAITVTDSAGATSSQNLTISVTGANDGAVIGGVNIGEVSEDNTLTASGKLTISDVDSAQAGFIAQNNLAATHGSFTLSASGDWTYALDNSNAAVQALKTGESLTDTATINSIDGTQHTIAVTINGSNDGAIIAGVDTATATEDANVIAGKIEASGQLTISDPDAGQSHFTAQTDVAGSSGYGHFSLNSTGAWTYSADNTQTAIQQLKASDSLTDTLTVTSADGTTHMLTVTIQGTNDAPVLAAQSQAVTEDGTQLSGHMVATDVDTGDTQTFSIAHAVDGFTLNANGSYSFDPSHASYQHLAAGQTLTITIPVTVTDVAGATSTQDLIIKLNGSNDGAVITGTDIAAVTEDQTAGSGHFLQVTGILTVADVDTGEAMFQATSAKGQLGDFILHSDGSWMYQADNTNTAVQALKAGQQTTDSFTVLSTDGTTHTITLKITGSNDAPTVAHALTTTTATEDSAFSFSIPTGTFADIDTGDKLTLSAGSLPAWLHFDAATGTFSGTPTNGDVGTIQVTITATDANGAQVSTTFALTVANTNDAPTLNPIATVHATEDGAQVTGQFTATDPDSGDTLIYSITQPVNGFTLNADGSYSFDPSHASYQHLAAGQTQDVLIPITVTDSTGATSTQNLSITVTGVNDGAVIGGVDVGTVTEDAAVTTGHLQASDQLTISDADNGEAHFTAQTNVAGSTGYGHFSVDAAGAWTYSADNTQAAIQQLKTGESLTDTLTVASTDGTTHTVTVTIQGTNDAPVLQAQTQAVTEDGTQLSGHMVATDVDTSDTLTFSLANAVDGFTLNADGSYSFDPSHPSYQHLTAGQTQDVVIAITVTDSAGATSTQNLSITVTGVNDGAVIGGQFYQELVEDRVSPGNLLAISGQLTITDVDAGEAHFTAQTDVLGSAGVGHFSIDTDGQWHYEADNSQSAIQRLRPGDPRLIDTLVVTSVDGTTHTLSVAIQGIDDAPVLTAQTQAVTEDGTQLTGQMVATDVDTSDTLTFSLANAVDGFTLNADGSYSFDPSHPSYQHLAAGQTQDIIIPITVIDSAGATSTQNLTITVSGSNNGPQVTHGTAATAADLGAINEDTPRLFTEAELLQAVGASDVDDGAQLHIVAGSLTSAHGTFSGDAAHGYTFTPAANFSGQDVELKFSVSDGTVSREAHGQLDITPVADAPDRLAGHQLLSNFDDATGAADWHTNTGGHAPLQASVTGGQGAVIVSGSASESIHQTLDTFAGQRLHVAFDLMTGPGYPISTLDVLWEGKIVATIETSHQLHGRSHHALDLVASGPDSRLEFKAAHSPNHATAVEVDNIGLTYVDVRSHREAVTNQDLRLSLDSEFRLTDSDGSESLHYLIKGLPVGFTLTDGTHSVTVGQADQVIDTRGWQQDALRVQAPHDYTGAVDIQVTARSEEAGNQQTADAPLLPMRLNFESADALTVAEDTPKTFSADKLLALAGLVAPPGQHLSLSDVQVDAALGHFSHNSNGSWTFTPAANVSADQVPITLTATGGAQPLTASLSLNITPVVDAPAGGLTVNTDFDHQSVGHDGWAYVDGTGMGWHTDYAKGIEVGQDKLYGGTSSTNQVLELVANTDKNIYRDLPTTAGQALHFGFDLSARAGSTVATLEVVWEGKVIDTIKPGSAFGLVHHDYDLVATGANSRIELRATGGDGRAIIDNIAINPPPVVGLVNHAVHLDVGQAFQLADTDGSESISYLIKDLPVGATLSDGSHSVTVSAAGQVIDIQGWQLDALTLQAPKDFEGQLDFKVSARAEEGATHETALSADQSMRLRFEHLETAEDTPKTFSESELLQLAGIRAPAGQSYTLSDVQVDPAFGHFTHDADGKWTFTPAANVSAAQVALTLTVTGGALPITATLPLNITPVADVPVHEASTGGSGQAISTDFNSVAVGGDGWAYVDGAGTGWHTDYAKGIQVGQDRLYGGSSSNQIVELNAGAGNNIYRNLPTTSGQILHFGFDLSARGGNTVGALEVVWEGKVIDTITPASSFGLVHHEYDLLATGVNSRLELRATGGGDGRAILDNIDIGAPVDPLLAQVNHDLNLTHELHLADTDGSETLTYIVKGLPVGFTLTDGTHSATVATAGQVIETTGWDQDALMVRAPQDYAGQLAIQVSARAEETGNHQMATSADMTLSLSFENPSTTEDTPKTFTASQLMQLAGIKVPAGQTYTVDDVQVDPAFGQVSHDANGSWTFTPAANVSADAVPLSVHVSGGGQALSGTVSLNITPVVDAPVLEVGSGPQPFNLSANFDQMVMGSAGWTTADPAAAGWHTDHSGGVEMATEKVYGGTSDTSVAVGLIANAGANLFRDVPTLTGQAVHLSFDLSARPSYGKSPIEVLWEGKVIDTITPSADGFAMVRHDYDLVATGSNSRIELRASGSGDQRVLLDNLQVVGLPTAQQALVNHDFRLDLSHDLHLADTDGSETLTYIVKGLPIGFTLTDGTHIVTVTTAGQVIETVGWMQDALMLRSPQDFHGDVNLQVSARAEETANHQMATSADMGLRISFERLETLEDTPLTLSESKLLALASVVPAAGEHLSLIDVQVDAAFGLFSHNADGSWTFTPAANVNADQVPFTLTVSGGSQPISSSLQLSITPVNDAPVLAAQTQTVTEDDSLLRGHMVATDVDTGDTRIFSLANAVDGFTLNADGSYSFDPGHASYQHLTAGQTQDVVIPITVTDSAGATSTQSLTITVMGRDDITVISGDIVTTLTEDQNVNSQGNLEHFGKLSVSASDSGTAEFVPQNAVQTQYGRYTIDQTGFWLYEADNKQEAIQQLKTGEHLTDSFTVHSADGTAQTITVTIQGQDDAATFSAVQNYSDDIYIPIGVTLMSAGPKEFEYISQVLLANQLPRNYVTAEVAITTPGGIGLRSPDGSISVIYHSTGGVANVPLMDLQAWHNKGAGYEVVLVDHPGGEVQIYAHDQGNPAQLSGFNAYVAGISNPSQAALGFNPTMHDVLAASVGAAVQGAALMPPAIAPLDFDSGHVLEDNGQQISGFIEVKDADAGQSAMTPQTDTATHYGRFSIDINGDWVYQLDTQCPEVQQLADGQTLIDTITVHSEDGTAHEVNVTIHGQNDGAVIAGADSGREIEDQQVNAAGNIVAKGLLTVTDVDAGQAAFVAQSDVVTQYGHFSLAADGHWIYTVDNSRTDIQALKPGGTPGETADVSLLLAQVLGQSNEAGFKAVAEALTQQQPSAAAGVLDLSIQGAAIVLSGPTGTTPVVYAMDANGRANIGVDELLSWLHQGKGYELHLQGSQSDVQVFVHDRGDAGDLHPLPLSAATVLNDPASAAQHLALNWQTAPLPAELSETVTVRSVDGTEHIINLSIVGTAENAVIAGVDRGSVTEDAHVTGTGQIEAHGKLTIQDTDGGQAAFTSLHQVAGKFGHLSLQADGQWTYSADNNSAALNALNKGQSAVETFVVKSVDGTAHTLSITVNGADEKPDLWPEIAHNLMAQSGGDTRGYHVIAERMAAGDSNGLRDVVMNVYDGKPTVVDAAGHVLHTFDRYSKFFGYYMPMNELCEQLKAHPGAMLVLQGSVGGNANYYFHNADNEMLLNFNGAYSYEPDKHPIGGLPINGIPHSGASVISNMPAQLGGADSGSVLADGDALLQTQGHLTVLDADGGQAHFTAQQAVQGQYGSFSIDAQGSWHYQADGHAPALSQLAAGQQLSETFTVHSADGTSHTITVQLFGDNASAAVISGADTASLSEDQAVQAGQLRASGQLNITDGDAGQAHFNAQTDVAGSAGLGHFSLDTSGAWTYNVDNSRPEIQQLKASETITDTLTISSADGTTHQITVTLSGSNDAAVITGADSGAVSEDGGLSASGKLVISDADSGQASFTPQHQAAAHGSFTLTASGDWTYTLDNHSAAVQALKTGESLSDSITVQSVDGSSHVVTVRINGANDAPVLQAQSQTVAEDGSVLRGQMQASDVDHGEHLRFSTSAQVAGFNLNADGSYSFNPGHADYQSLTAGQQRDLSIPVVVTDASGAHATQMLTLHITGSNDGAMISGIDTGHVQVGGQAQVDGQLQVSDADAGQAGFQASQVAGSFGSLSIDAQGHWQYQLNSSDSFVQQLLPHSSLTDQLSVHSLDGTTHNIDVQISGPVAVQQPPIYQPPVQQPVQGHDAYANILAAVRAGGYQYQAIADALEHGDRAPMANVELAISGSHVQIVDAAGHVVQTYGPLGAEWAASVPMADLMLWHAQGHSIIVNNDSGMSSTHVWLHDAGDIHNLHINVGGSGFNGWVGEYSLGELSLSPAIAYPAPAPAPAASDEQDGEPIQIENLNEVIQNEDGMQSMTVVGVNVSDDAVTGNNDRPLLLNPATGDIGDLSELSLSSRHGTPLTTTDAHFAAQASPVDHYLQMLGLSPTTVNLSPSVPVELLPTLSSSDHFNDIDAPMHAIPEVNHFENPLLDNDKEHHKDRHFDLFDVTELHTNPNDDDLLHSALNDMHNQM